MAEDMVIAVTICQLGISFDRNSELLTTNKPDQERK
jgi:hypothetical protein